MGEKEIKLILDVINRGGRVEVYKRPRTGEIIVIEVKKEILTGK